MIRGDVRRSVWKADGCKVQTWEKNGVGNEGVRFNLRNSASIVDVERSDTGSWESSNLRDVTHGSGIKITGNGGEGDI